jgi:hypothetical protein
METWLEAEFEMIWQPSKPTMNIIRALTVGVLLVATLSSCVAPAKVSEDKDANGKKIEYVYYTPTGSNLPIRVRKDQLTTSDADAATEKKLIDDMQRGAAGPPKAPGSN